MGQSVVWKVAHRTNDRRLASTQTLLRQSCLLPVRHWASALMLALTLMSTVGCDGHTHFAGKITDGAGAAISEAEVTLSSGSQITDGWSTESDLNGNYEIALTHYSLIEHLTLTVAKEGFQEYSEQVAPKSRDDFNIVLKEAVQE